MTTTDTTLKLSLRDLPRTLGATAHREVDWTVPDDLGTSAMWVAPGSILHLDVDLTTVDEGVLAQVAGDVELQGECVRCLDPVVEQGEFHAAEVYFEPRKGRSALTSEDEIPEDLLTIQDGDLVDLEPLVRDEILDMVNPLPLCRPDCPGLCPQCGIRLADAPADHHHDDIDPRLAALAALLETVEGGAAGSGYGAAGEESPGGDRADRDQSDVDETAGSDQA
ncbi:MAG: YceD family protein [Pauljensenia sp.]